MHLLDLSRWQFATTVLFHMTFPSITVGLSILLCVLYGRYWKTSAGRPMHPRPRMVLGIAGLSCTRLLINVRSAS